MKKILLFVASIFVLGNIQAQDPGDALRFSSYGLNGTANFISKAGAIGALGGDFTAASYNPAGLGIYSTSELSISMGYYGGFTGSDYNGNKLSDSRSNFNFGNIGALFNFKNSDGNFKNTQFAFGLNRLNSFGNRTIFEREGVNKSYISHIIDNRSDDDMFMYDFFKSGVVDTVAGAYTSVFKTGTFSQIRTYKESGSTNEMTLSFSTNYQDVLYIGATLGMPIGEYHRSGSFAETLHDNTGAATESYIYNEQLDLYATGINFKAGVIAQPIEFLRLGAAIHTPTYYNVEDNFYSEVLFETKSGGVWDPILYDIQSPFKFLGSMAIILGDKDSKVKGTLSADYDYSNYSTMKFRTNDLNEIMMNKNIENMYKETHNLRFGAEVKLGNLAIRGGYATYQNPYKHNINDAGKDYITAGLGIRGKHYVLDFGYAYSFGESSYNEYDYDRINLTNTQHIVQATLGLRF